MATMHAALSTTKTTTEGRPRNTRYAILLCIAAAVTVAAMLWFRPFWLIDRATQVRLATAGMHSQNVMIDGHKIHYLVGGTGEPIVLVHGLGSRATDWVGLIPALVHGGRRVYALDLLGYGESDRPADSQYSIEEEAQIVEGFMRAEDLQHADLAGWSMGGWVSMVVATETPQRIARLVLLDSAGLRFQPTFDPTLFTPTDVGQLRQLERLLSPNAPAMPTFLARAFLVRARPDAWVIRRSVDSMLTGQNLLDNKLAQLKMPVLIVWGKEDRLTPLSLAYTLHAGVPNSTLDVFEGCGHLAPGLCAKQIAPKLLTFLGEKTPGRDNALKSATLERAGTY